MGELFYCLDGVTVNGPVTESTLRQLLSTNVITESTSVIKAGERDWRTTKDYLSIVSSLLPSLPEPPPSSAQEVKIDPDTIKKADGADEPCEKKRKATERDDDQEVVSKRELLKGIRADLEMLWETQLESIMSRIRNQPLDKQYETTRKQSKEVYERIEKSCIAYWRKSGVLEDWIDSLIWRSDDFVADLRRRLRGNSAIEKLEDAQKWLERSGLWDESGCYCFMAEKEYIYIGQAGSLGVRVKDRIYWGDATHLRILIPKNKRWLNKLERMLILNYEPRKNDKPGILSGNPVSDTLEFIRNEIKELVTDF